LAEQFGFHFHLTEDLNMNGSIVGELCPSESAIGKGRTKPATADAAPCTAAVSAETDGTAVRDADRRVDPKKGLGG
jgi:hypothetical protein